jgi:hypothetical protein
MKVLYLETEKVTEPILHELTRDGYKKDYPVSQKLYLFIINKAVSISTQHRHHSPLVMVAIKHFACHYDSMQVTKLYKAAAPVRPSGKPNKREAKKPNTHTYTYTHMS